MNDTAQGGEMNVVNVTCRAVCDWIQDYDGVWWTGCGEGQLLDGTPRENKYKYCPYCGMRIRYKSARP